MATALLVVAGSLMLLLWRETYQQRRDNALIAAIHTGNADAVTGLLAHGANPNARVPTYSPPGPSLADYVNRLQLRFSPLTMPSALQIALQNALNVQPPNRLFAGHDEQSGTAPNAIPLCMIVETLIRHRASIRFDTKRANMSLASLEEQLARLPREPHFEDLTEPGSGKPPLALKTFEVAEEFKTNILNFGPSGPAFVGLGQSQLRLGAFAAADRSFRLARLYNSDDPLAIAGQAQAKALCRVRSAIARALPPDEMVAELRALPGLQGDRWMVLTRRGHGASVRVRICSVSANGGRLLAASPVLPAMPGSTEDPEAHFEGIYLRSLTGGPEPDVIVRRTCLRNKRWRMRLDAFSIAQSRLVPVLSLTTASSLRPLSGGRAIAAMRQ